MLATLVYLADEAAENFCGKVTLDPARFRACVQEMPADRYTGKHLRFDHMGVFFYDADTYAASRYYCCRRFLLK